MSRTLLGKLRYGSLTSPITWFTSTERSFLERTLRPGSEKNSVEAIGLTAPAVKGNRALPTDCDATSPGWLGSRRWGRRGRATLARGGHRCSGITLLHRLGRSLSWPDE